MGRASGSVTRKNSKRLMPIEGRGSGCSPERAAPMNDVKHSSVSVDHRTAGICSTSDRSGSSRSRSSFRRPGVWRERALLTAPPAGLSRGRFSWKALPHPAGIGAGKARGLAELVELLFRVVDAGLRLVDRVAQALELHRPRGRRALAGRRDRALLTVLLLLREAKLAFRVGQLVLGAVRLRAPPGLVLSVVIEDVARLESAGLGAVLRLLLRAGFAALGHVVVRRLLSGARRPLDRFLGLRARLHELHAVSQRHLRAGEPRAPGDELLAVHGGR